MAGKKLCRSEPRDIMRANITARCCGELSHEFERDVIVVRTNIQHIDHPSACGDAGGDRWHEGGAGI